MLAFYFNMESCPKRNKNVLAANTFYLISDVVPC